ncbi:serine/threonine-protein kinase NIM1 [Parasteatoda tepidariorum]|uniref:serine/threonine-protein kinase NIM1 n=1 Tax=Parasteatoda tepidariorum TaxID=114398 RepID=UPI00077FCCBE|nr:serine/threonine-protein kinase NIM1 [Parasteatoda tepidariorum]
MTSEKLPSSAIKAGQWWRKRLKSLNSNSCDPNQDLEEDKSKATNDETSSNASLPLDRKRTATLTRRKTFHVADDSKGIIFHPAKIGRPRRSISDESTVSTSVTSLTTSHQEQQRAYHQALHKLSHDDRWKKEIALGTRVSLYRLYRDVGKGNFSKVKMAVHYLTKEKVAVKIIEKAKLQAKSKQMLSKEISAMEAIQHPHIIRLYEVIETPSKLFIAMEFAEGGELFHKVSNGGKLPESEAKVLFSQLTSAVFYLHKNNIIHRDLKAENIFICGKNTIKVGDFGFSTRVQNPKEQLLTFCGSPPYVAPEIFQNENYVGSSVDIWSLGVLLYFMVSAALPFKGDTVSVVKRKILAGHYSVPKFITQECTDLINGLLQLDPSKRLTCNQIKSCQWLKGAFFPSPGNGKNSIVQKETKEFLNSLGITENILQEHLPKGARSNVNGTYRIISHKKEALYSANDGKHHNSRKIVISCPTFQSKTCVIV